MLFTTPTQYAVLALLLVAGWLFGLASASGGQRWRERYAAERDAHAATRRELDAHATAANARVADAERAHADRLAAAEARAAELGRENDRLRTAAPVTAQTIAPATPAGSTTIVRPTGEPVAAAPIARPAYPDERPV
jgi:hypothetical protein